MSLGIISFRRTHNAPGGPSFKNYQIGDINEEKIFARILSCCYGNISSSYVEPASPRQSSCSHLGNFVLSPEL
jgi:hypothetical protein